MLHLLYTTGSPFARAVRIVLDEIGLDYERHEESVAPRAWQLAPPTLQVPTFWDGDLKLWESGTIVEYLLSTFTQRPAVEPPLANQAFRVDALWRDKLVFSTIQTFGTAATTISQMKWTGVAFRCKRPSRAFGRETLSHSCMARWPARRSGERLPAGAPINPRHLSRGARPLC